jgi:UDP-galactopyranose mutase
MQFINLKGFFMKVDWLIVGAGFSGSVLAERLSTQLGKKVLLVDQRNHIGGNAFDYYDENDILVHQYGPHIFHTNAQYVWEYLSHFTQWRSYYHHVLGMVDGRLIPIPFNFNSLEAVFPRKFVDKLIKQLLKDYGFNTKVPILKLRENTSGDLKFLSEYVYENVFKKYTLKQWDLTPEELGPTVTSRVPIYLSRDDRYFQDTYQGMPKFGYTPMFQKMLTHKNIRILLNTPWQDIKDEIDYEGIIFTGEIDAFFNHCYGKLPYRSLRFEMGYEPVTQIQPVGTVNYPNEHLYTRITEFKTLTGQQHTGTTWMSEYPQPYLFGENDPYYPIPQEQNRELYRKYLKETEQLGERVVFAGRLGDYQYYNMDQAVARALSLFEKNIKPFYL